MNKQAMLEKQIMKWQLEQKPWIKMGHLYSWLRLGCMIMAVGMAIYGDQTGRSFAFIIALMFLVLFSVLVYRHNQLKQRLRRQQAQIAVYEKLSRRCDDRWKEENGDSVCGDDPLAYDLDLFGPHSLFTYLDFTTTMYGKQRLMSLLKGEDDQMEAIIRRQDAIKELLDKEALLLDYECGSLLFAQDSRKWKAQDLDFLIAYAKKQDHLFPQWFVYVSMIMSGATILTLLLGLFQLLPYGYSAVLMLANTIVSLCITKSCENALSFTKDLNHALKDYEALFQTVEKGDFQTSLLKEYQEMMMQGYQGLKRLQRISNLLTFRHNILAYMVLAALFQIDVWAILLLEKWRKQDGKMITTWLQAVGDMEALVSLSVLAQVKERWCFPTFINQKTPYYELHEGVHPLINEAQTVANTIMLEKGSYVITGSNMSGKTTFLRMLGITMMLCRAGAPVCAKTMKTTGCHVYTSMRIKDDVNEGISTFYAELLRIKMMMDASKKQTTMLVLIDEIFKGTNSADRILCAKTAIAKLHLPWVITLVSTHDFALCDCEQDPLIQAVNYHFSEYYEQDEIKFDYCLKSGRCTSTNAKALMRLAGIND